MSKIKSLQRKPKDTNLQMKCFTTTRRIRVIEIDELNSDIKVVRTVDDQIQVKYYESEDYYYNITDDGGKLIIEKKVNRYKRKWFDFLFNSDNERTNLVLSIPDDYSRTIGVKSCNGSIELTNVNASALYITTSNGRIFANDIRVSGVIDVDTSNGEIDFYRVKCKKDILCNTCNGRIKFNDTEGSNIRVTSSNGEIELHTVYSLNQIVATTTNSNIKLDKIKFDKLLECMSSNGAVTGSIAGKLTDFSIISETLNGKNNLPGNMDGGDKKIKIKTSNGNIDVNFD